VDARVGAGDQLGQAHFDRVAAFGQPLLQLGDGGIGGDLARLGATHAIRDREQGRPSEDGVLVHRARTARVGMLEVLSDAQHLIPVGEFALTKLEPIARVEGLRTAEQLLV